MGEFDLSRVFVNTGGYGLQLAPLDVPQPPDLEHSNQTNVQPQSAYSPVISPPGTISSIDDEYLAISDYAAIEAEVLGNIPPEVIEAYYAGEAVPEYQNVILERYDAAREALVEVGRALFEQAFIFGPDPMAENNWRGFEDLLREYGIKENITELLICLANPQMDPEDRELLYNVAFAENAADELSQQVGDRFVESWRGATLVYNGWGTVPSGERSFLNAFELIIGDNFQAYAQEVFDQRLSEVLALFSEEAAQRYLQMNEADFLAELQITKREWREAPLGSDLKIVSLQRYEDLITIAYLLGLVVGEGGEAQANINLAGLTEAELEMLTGSFSDQTQFISTVSYFADQYLLAERGTERRASLRDTLGSLDIMAPEYGVSVTEMDGYLSNAAQNLGISLQPEGSISSLENLTDDIYVSPDGLPPEVKEILIETGYWDLVQGLYEIKFTTEDLQIDRYSDYMGLADPYFGSVEIEYVGRAPWEIAGILVHEAAHVAWRREAQNQYERDSLPNERHSYLTELRFFSRYLELANDEDREYVAFVCEEVRSYGLAASAALGDGNDLDPDSHLLPSSSYLATLGLSDISQFDFNIHAAKQSQIHDLDPFWLATFIDRQNAGLSNEEFRAAQAIMSAVLTGEAFLSGRYSYSEDDPAILDPVPTITLLSDSGPSRELTAFEVTALQKILGFIYNISIRHFYSSSGNNEGYNFSLSARDLLNIIDNSH
jgi:hypothetical protein